MAHPDCEGTPGGVRSCEGAEEEGGCHCHFKVLQRVLESPFVKRQEALLTMEALVRNRSTKTFLPFQSIGGRTEMRD